MRSIILSVLTVLLFAGCQYSSSDSALTVTQLLASPAAHDNQVVKLKCYWITDGYEYLSDRPVRASAPPVVMLNAVGNSPAERLIFLAITGTPLPSSPQAQPQIAAASAEINAGAVFEVEVTGIFHAKAPASNFGRDLEFRPDSLPRGASEVVAQALKIIRKTTFQAGQ